jgi:hypothetical protein
LLGLITGVVMVALVVFIPRLEPSGDPQKQLPFTMAALFTALLFSAVVLFVYHALAPRYFVWFGLMAVFSFLLLIVIRTAPQIMKSKRRV